MFVVFFSLARLTCFELSKNISDSAEASSNSSLTMSLNFVPLRKLGKDDPSVPALGFGLIGMALLYGTPPEKEEVFKFLERAVEIGETFWDTSE